MTPTLDAVADHAMDVQSAISAAIIHSVLDDILLSAKLFLLGKQAPSGHMVQQTAGGLSFAVMCASSKPREVLEKNVEKQKAERTQVAYWKLFVASDPDQLHRCELLGSDILKTSVAMGGTVAGEHGVEVEKVNSVCVQLSAADNAQMLVRGGGGADQAPGSAAVLALRAPRRFGRCVG